MNKNIDTLVIGNNITSFLTSTQILKSGHDAVYLRDHRIKTNDPFFKFYGPIDLSFIKAWISDIDIETTLFNEENFELSPFYLLVDGRRYNLASKSPYLNITQLTRHFPKLHQQIEGILAAEEKGSGDFDEEFLSSIERLGESLCRYKTIHQVSLATFKSALPKFLFDCFMAFKAQYKTDAKLKRVLVSLRCVYTQSIELTFSDLELIYFFLVLLSPRYRFHWSLGLDGLAKDTIEKLGGTMLEDTIEEFSFSNSKPWATQLASYSGVVAPGKMAIFSSNVESLGIGHDLNSTFGCIKLNYQLDDKLLSGEYYYFNPASFGSEIAYIRKRISANGLCEIKIYAQFNDCLKIEFVQDKFDQILRKDGMIDSEDKLIGCSIVDEVCLLRNHGHFNTRGSVNLKFRTGVKGKLEKVKGVYYHGPLKKNSLGITQTLLEARDYKTFI